jgi:hypothetical protein
MLLRLLAVCMLASQAFAFRSVFSNSRALAGLSRASPSSLQSSSKEIPTTTEGWKTILSPSQFEVLRRKATEPPGYSEGKEGELEYVLKEKYGTKYPKEGTYACAGCGTPLYAAKSKFDSGCGWPVSNLAVSFYHLFLFIIATCHNVVFVNSLMMYQHCFRFILVALGVLRRPARCHYRAPRC